MANAKPLTFERVWKLVTNYAGAVRYPHNGPDPAGDKAKADLQAALRQLTDGAPVTRADAVRMAEEVGMLGDVKLNAPALVRFAQLVLSTYGVIGKEIDRG